MLESRNAIEAKERKKKKKKVKIKKEIRKSGKAVCESKWSENRWHVRRRRLKLFEGKIDEIKGEVVLSSPRPSMFLL